MFAGRHEIVTNEDNEVVLDRNPDIFRIMIDYLRSNFSHKILVKDEVTKNKVMAEFNFWCIKPESDICLEKDLSQGTIFHSKLELLFDM